MSPISAHVASLNINWEIAMENVLNENPLVERLIRIDEVKRLTGLSTATIYRKISANEFPPPVHLGAVARAWPLSEVQAWIAGRVSMRGPRNFGRPL
jgi:prophage regulatory protein